jgi:hypothetical protein
MVYVPAALYVTPVTLLEVDDAGVEFAPKFHEYVVPAMLVPVFVKEKLLPVKHWLADCVNVDVTGTDGATVTVPVLIQPLASVTVTVYVPDARLLADEAVPPDGAHE